jgi:hypothetical protein
VPRRGARTRFGLVAAVRARPAAATTAGPRLCGFPAAEEGIARGPATSRAGVLCHGYRTVPATPNSNAANAAPTAAERSIGRIDRNDRRAGGARPGRENPSSEAQKPIPPYRLAAT